MTSRVLSIYRAALFAPLVLGALIVIVLTLFGDVEWINRFLGDLGILLVLVGAVCGVPWLVLSVGLLVWSRGKRDDQMKRALLVFPPVLALVSTATWLGYLMAQQGPEDRPIAWLSLGLKIATLIIVLAYAYIGLTLLIARTARDHERVADAA